MYLVTYLPVDESFPREKNTVCVTTDEISYSDLISITEKEAKRRKIIEKTGDYD